MKRVVIIVSCQVLSVIPACPESDSLLDSRQAGVTIQTTRHYKVDMTIVILIVAVLVFFFIPKKEKGQRAVVAVDLKLSEFELPEIVSSGKDPSMISTRR